MVHVLTGLGLSGLLSFVDFDSTGVGVVITVSTLSSTAIRITRGIYLLIDGEFPHCSLDISFPVA